MNVLISISFILAAYLVGAIPFGYLLTRHYTGKNILKEGSGNVGSTNVRRIAGRTVSIYTQILDILKGFIPVGIYLLLSNKLVYSLNEQLIYIIALASIIGHDFSIFLRFRGGKGVNTTLGASVLIAPWAVISGIIMYYIVKKAFKYVSIGSIVLSLTLPLAEIIINGVNPALYYLIVCSLLIVILHRKNLQRLLKGKENL